MIYYAKSNPKKTVKDHLEAVSKEARRFGSEIGCPKSAELAGMLHDFGKYSTDFQEVIQGTRQDVDHALGGAAVLYNTSRRNRYYYPIIEAINGHHDGLTEIELLRPNLENTILKDTDLENKNGKFSALAGKDEYHKAFHAFTNDFPTEEFKKIAAQTETFDFADSLDAMIYTRMLYSCLVDADYSVSAADNNPDYMQETEIINADFGDMLNRLNRYRNEIKENSNADGNVNRIRDEVFNICGNGGTAYDPGLFTLTAPTGTGKTLALFHFALRHCIRNHMRRIIIVLPFLSLTDQSADVYRKIYADILEDHSQSQLSDKERELAERWSVPVIVTTSVQFFESLFSDKPGDCRKLHSIANSVIVFDEAQSLPLKLTPATLKTVKHLIERYRATMVFSTATQPDYSAIQDVIWQPIEILPDYPSLFAALKRTFVEWKLEKKTPLNEIADVMTGQNNTCAIVNLKQHADILYNSLSNQCSSDELFYLTTELCPAHRRIVISSIKQRQQNGLPCRVIATQCIEAGVDLDFDVVYRALAPLESIVQAAGRCNRNGKLNGKSGKVIVFIPDEPEPLYPGNKGDNWYETAAQKVKALNECHTIDIHNPTHLKEYYDLLFQTTRDKPLESVSLTNAIRKHSFESVSREYRLIDNAGYQLIVPYPNEKNCMTYEQIHSHAVTKGLTKKLIKESAAITVSIGFSQKDKLERYAEELQFPDKNRNSGFYILRPQYYEKYDIKRGICLSEDSTSYDGIF